MLRFSALMVSLLLVLGCANEDASTSMPDMTAPPTDSMTSADSSLLDADNGQVDAGMELDEGLPMLS